MEPKWLEWTKALQAIAQNGLTYAENPFDIQRYEQVRDIAAEIAACYSQTAKDYVLDLFAAQSGYATPKVDVRGVVFRGEQILLVRERSDGRWSLPGGWADVNETPRQAVEREVWEESGYKAKAQKILAVYDRSKHGHYPPRPYHVYKLFILCQLTGGTSTVSMETSEIGFFAADALPELSIARVTPAQIVRFFEHYHNQDLPTDFD